MNSINVKIFGIDMGLLHYHNDELLFHYYPSFIQTKLEPSPLRMANKENSYNYSGIEYRHCLHLPHMIADTLPDKFGSSVMKAYLVGKKIDYNELTPLEKLAYIGDRGIGALSFEPTLIHFSATSKAIDLAEFQKMCQLVKDEKLQRGLNFSESKKIMRDLMLVSTTAGGAQPKALIYRKGNRLLSGLSKPKVGYTYEIIKVINRENIDAGKIEFIYHKIAKAVGITMTQPKSRK